MKTNKAKKRGKFPFPVIILALLGGLFLGSINLISGDSWIDGGAYIYPNSSLSNNVNVINGTLQVMNIPVCLMDGTNCPNMTGNSSQCPAGTNGTNGLNGTGIKNIYVLSNGSIVVNLTNGTNIISGNLTGPKGDTGSTGSQGPQGDPGIDGNNFTYSDWFDQELNTTSAVTFDSVNTIGLNAESLEGLTTLTIQSIPGTYFFVDDGTGKVGVNLVSGTQLTDQSSAFFVDGSANITGNLYTNGYLVCQSDGTNCPSGGNSSWNQSGYWINASASFYPLRTNPLGFYNVTTLPTYPVADNTSWNQSGYWNNASASFYPLKTNPLGFYNSSTIPAYVLISSLSGAVGQNLTYALINTNMGNWSADKASYATNVHVANVNATALKNATVASLAGLTVTSDATVEGVFVVDPGTATAAAVRVGGPLTTYSALQFQSEQNRTRDFIFSSVNNSVASNRMAFRVSGNEAGSNSGGDLSVLRFDDAGGFIDTVMKIDRSDGFVGIGDSTPDAKLDVVGDTILDGGVTISGVTSVEGYRVLPSWTNYTTAQYATVNNTVYTLMPSLTTTLAASHTYLVKCEFLTFSAAVTTGEQLRVNTTGAPTTVTWSFNSQVSATTRTSFQGVSTSTNAFADTGSAGTNVRDITFLTGYIVTSGSASTITYEMKSEIAASNAAYDTGSWCEYKVVA